ncbi:MAG: hypothetical protein IPK18_07890 [Sphingobacteriales bacterium]|jgi:hypothetical protein|nr:MAG: hypothetical protein IPK18_07890 [Sphingobacteriales bacterium]
MKKKILKYVLICFLLLVIVKQFQKKKNIKKDNQEIVLDNQTFDISIHIDKSFPKQINRNIFGMNTGFVWNTEIDKDSNFVHLLKSSNNQILRFPGGGVANDYQPDEPGYGYNPLKRPIAKPLIMLYNQTKDRKYNIIENFISLCHQSNAKAIYCANVLNGSPEKMLYVIKKLKEQNIEVVGVELGNEFNLGNYRHIFPNAKVYTDTIKRYIHALRKYHPDIPIGLIAEPLNLNQLTDKRSQFMHKWNLAISQEDFDAYIIHHYFPFDDRQKVFDNIYLKSSNLIDSATSEFVPNTIQYFKSIQKNKAKKLWLTEWNIWNAYAFNTFLQADFVGTFLNQIIAQDSNYVFDVTCMHDIGGLIAGAKNNIQYTYKENTRFASATYFSYKFLTDIVIKDEAQIVAIELSQQIKQFKLYAYYSTKTNQQYLYFSNSSGHQINLKIDAVVKSINYNYIVANKLYAHTGEAHFIKDNPTKNEFIELKKETIQNNTISIKPYSLGVIQY